MANILKIECLSSEELYYTLKLNGHLSSAQVVKHQQLSGKSYLNLTELQIRAYKLSKQISSELLESVSEVKKNPEKYVTSSKSPTRPINIPGSVRNDSVRSKIEQTLLKLPQDEASFSTIPKSPRARPKENNKKPPVFPTTKPDEEIKKPIPFVPNKLPKELPPEKPLKLVPKIPAYEKEISAKFVNPIQSRPLVVRSNSLSKSGRPPLPLPVEEPAEPIVEDYLEPVVGQENIYEPEPGLQNPKQLNKRSPAPIPPPEASSPKTPQLVSRRPSFGPITKLVNSLTILSRKQRVEEPSNIVSPAGNFSSRPLPEIPSDKRPQQEQEESLTYEDVESEPDSYIKLVSHEEANQSIRKQKGLESEQLPDYANTEPFPSDSRQQFPRKLSINREILAESLRKELDKRKLSSREKPEVDLPIYGNQEEFEEAEAPVNYGNVDFVQPKPAIKLNKKLVTSSLPRPPASLPPRPVSADIPAEDDQEPMGAHDYNLNDEPYFRNTDRKGAKILLSKLPEGAFLFRPSRVYFLTLTIKSSTGFYNVGIERTENNLFRCIALDNLEVPEFSSLSNFVEFFRVTPIGVHSLTDDTVYNVLLNPVLPADLY